MPDVDALMRRVQAGVADKLGRGVYTPADLEEVRRIEQEIRTCTAVGLAPADDIVRLHTSWDPLGPHTFTSHRGGVGKLIVTVKQLLRRLALPVAAVSLARQAEFNSTVARLLTISLHSAKSLAAGNDALQGRLDELERRNRELQMRCDELQATVRGGPARRERETPGEKPE